MTRAVVRVVVFVAAGVTALAASSVASAYGWPIRPFDRQHAIRGAFDDPREDERPGGVAQSSFHFGVDIAAPDWTAVYAVAPGTVFRYPDAVAVRRRDGHEFSYWHVEAVVAEHSFVRAGDLLGYIRAGWGHVHFAESDGRSYLNPLRPGALAPFTDTTAPVVGPIAVQAGAGALDATVEAYDPPPLAPPPPWQQARWAPALVRWRLLRDAQEAIPWRVAADFRVAWLPPSEFGDIYAPGTVQNHPGAPGRYVFWLARGLPLPDGSYTLQVEAEDTRGNTGSASLAFTLADGRARTR